MQIRANTSTDGSAGEITVAQFEDDSIQFNTNVTASGAISASGNIRSSRFEIDGATEYIDKALGNLFIVTTGHLAVQPGTGKALKVDGIIEATSNLKIEGSQVDFTNLPTSDPGVAGRLWNDSNTVKISAG